MKQKDKKEVKSIRQELSKIKREVRELKKVVIWQREQATKYIG
jgi:hypothetical protein